MPKRVQRIEWEVQALAEKVGGRRGEGEEWAAELCCETGSIAKAEQCRRSRSGRLPVLWARALKVRVGTHFKRLQAPPLPAGKVQAGIEAAEL